ncbi:MAG: HD-GYP domain-containing protein [Sedimentibacter sp.]
MFITKNHLKPGMILAKDLCLYDNNFKMFLLAKGEPLNIQYINKMLIYNIEGAFIVSDSFSDLDYEYGINKKLESKAITEIKRVYSELHENKGVLDDSSIHGFSSVVDELITEISVKKELTNDILYFRNHDEYTFQHCLSVANLSISTGLYMGLDKPMLHDLGMAAFLHDIGKAQIPLEILNKPGKLTHDEFEIMKGHPTNAVNMLKNLVSDEIRDGILSHHEKLDGTGYPNGKSGKDIPFYSKILALCDVYHALSSTRPYRKACFPNEVIEYIMGCADTHFDYDILNLFLKNVVAFPVGSFVKLSNGMMGFVIKNNKENNLRPIVRTIDSDNTVIEDINLYKNYLNATIVEMGQGPDDIDFKSILKESSSSK